MSSVSNSRLHLCTLLLTTEALRGAYEAEGTTSGKTMAEFHRHIMGLVASTSDVGRTVACVHEHCVLHMFYSAHFA